MALPLLVPLIASAITWIFREIVVKFLVFTAAISLVVFLVPFVVSYLGDFIKPAFLVSAFSQIPSEVWFFLDFFALDSGLPLVISAYVSRFLIRRMPVIG
jgi:hypothetical protein